MLSISAAISSVYLHSQYKGVYISGSVSTMEGSPHAPAPARAEDDSDWYSLVKQRLPGYLRKQIKREKTELQRVLHEQTNLSTDEHLEDYATIQELREWRDETESKIEELVNATSDPMRWFLRTEAKYIDVWKDFSLVAPVIEFKHEGAHIMHISMFIGHVFRVVGVLLSVPQKRALRKYCQENIFKFPAPKGEADAFGQMGEILKGFKAECPNIPDLPVDDGIHETVSDRLVTEVMSSLASGEPR
jgi:hypothetical protein